MSSLHKVGLESLIGGQLRDCKYYDNTGRLVATFEDSWMALRFEDFLSTCQDAINDAYANGLEDGYETGTYDSYSGES